MKKRIFKFRVWNGKSLIYSDSYFDLEGFLMQ